MSINREENTDILTGSVPACNTIVQCNDCIWNTKLQPSPDLSSQYNSSNCQNIFICFRTISVKYLHLLRSPEKESWLNLSSPASPCYWSKGGCDHCHRLLIDQDNKNLFDDNYTDHIHFFTLNNFHLASRYYQHHCGHSWSAQTGKWIPLLHFNPSTFCWH